ncbi:MAG: (deoxy)nucleoside triphosphate pyrophosphohydrolase [Spirochaetota bacterium]
MESSTTHSTRISTAGIACNGDRYFVAKRKLGTSIGESWEFPGGKNRRKETPRETLIREFKEEFSVTVSVGRLLFSSSFTNKDTEYQLQAYEITFSDTSPQFLLTEHSETAWMTLEQISQIPMAESDRAIARALSLRNPVVK